MTAADALIRRGVDQRALTALAARLAPLARDGGVILLSGELGAGKTTFARALLAALGVTTRVKSPTYSLIESYTVGDLAIHHLDLYRIADPGELEWLGLADLVVQPHLILVEWPERAGNALPAADLSIALAHAGATRDVALSASSPRGQRWLNGLNAVSTLNAAG
jgi:tRNA threonylcarbamoyladenosine biosynthesis protein TsaE